MVAEEAKDLEEEAVAVVEVVVMARVIADLEAVFWEPVVGSEAVEMEVEAMVVALVVVMAVARAAAERVGKTNSKTQFQDSQC